jgi:hypothetical protein
MNEELKCHDCAHFLMKDGSVKVDLTGYTITATAVYDCDISKTPDSCKKYTRAYIEDIITYSRGTPRGKDVT